jgi:hypothetical protein
VKEERIGIASDVHEIYLRTAKARGWPVKPEVDVPFAELSEDAQALDLAFADYLLDALTEARAEKDRIATMVAEACDERDEARRERDEWQQAAMDTRLVRADIELPDAATFRREQSKAATDLLTRCDQAEAERDEIVGIIQRRLQPGGSPPPGDARVLVEWICSEAQAERDRLEEELGNVRGDYDRAMAERDRLGEEVGRLRRPVKWDAHYYIAWAIDDLKELCEIVDAQTGGDDTTKSAKKQIHNLGLVLEEVKPLCAPSPAAAKARAGRGES